jgi:predicted metal-dependent hydrolase
MRWRWLPIAARDGPMSDSGSQLDLLADATSIGGLSVRRSHRARRMSIRVDPLGSVEVVVPERARSPEVRSFVEENRDWIARTRDQLLRGRGPVSVERPSTIDLKAVREQRAVVYDGQCQGPLRLVDDGKTIVVRGALDDSMRVNRLFISWLKDEARKVFPPQVEELGEKYGLSHRRVQIRAQRSRWGSCSHHGTISLNCMLLLLAPELVRYLLVHELCHLRHLNHSRRFWRLVEQYEPGYRELDRQLARAWQELPGWALVR